VRDLDRKADAILSQVNTAAQNDARMSSRLSELLLEVNSSISAADKYILVHSVDIGATTLKYLATAKENLVAMQAELDKLNAGQYEEAARTQAWERALGYAKAADLAADKALATAKANVDTADSSRRSSYVPSYNSYPPSGGDTTVVVVNNNDYGSGSGGYGGWGDSNNSRPDREGRGSDSGTRSRRESDSQSSSSGTRASRSSSTPAPSSSGTRASRPSTPSFSSSSGTRASRPSPSSTPSFSSRSSSSSSRPSSSPTRSSPSPSRPSSPSSSGGSRARR
jgi:hypothetical protein